jgi:hypothetical protein
VVSPNELTRPDGAATVLDNCNIDSDNVVESRRGFAEFGNSTENDAVVKQLMTYKGRILRHFENKLSFDSTGSGQFLNFSGSYSELVNKLRIKYFELNSNLYFTTNEGIKKISAKTAGDFSTSSNYITNAGGVKAVGLEARIVPASSGFLPAQSKVAYKVLWAVKDVNGNIIRGVPSSRYVVTNTSQDINVGESFSVEINDAGAGIHKQFDSTSGISLGVQFPFLAANVNITTNTITLTTGSTDHNFQTNDLIKLVAGSSTLPTGLTEGNYYVIRVSTNSIKLKNSIEGTEIDITATGTGGTVESTNVGSTITIPSHGFSNGSKVRLYGDIPKELNTSSTFYVISSATDTFQLSSTEAGTAITLTKKEGTSYIYSGLNSDHFFTFDTPTNKYGVWFNVSGNDTPPTNTLLVGRQILAVDLSTITNKNRINYASKIAEVLYTITDVSVELELDKLTITNTDAGNVLDASSGNIPQTPTKYAEVSTVSNGQTAFGTPANTVLTFTVPTSIVSKDYFYEIYRTAVVTVQTGVTLNDIDPGEEFQKVYEAPVAENNDPIPSEITIEETVPESFREGGAYLYVNPVSGEGILQANEAPPIAHDVAVFKGSAFYANTKERHRFQLNMLPITQFISGESKIYIGTSQTLREYVFVGSPQKVSFTAKKKSDTVGGSYIDLYSAQNRIKYRIWFDKGTVSYSFDSTADVDLNRITINNHLFANNDEVVFKDTVPTGLAVDTIYYIVNKDANSFQVASSLGGTALPLTDVVGTATVTHSSKTPVQDSSILLRVSLREYDNTEQQSVDAFIAAFEDVFDFSVTDASPEVDSAVIEVLYTDNGEAEEPTDSTPASTWIFDVIDYGNGEDASANQVLLSGLTSESLALEDTARSLERVINKDPTIYFTP